MNLEWIDFKLCDFVLDYFLSGHFNLCFRVAVGLRKFQLPTLCLPLLFCHPFYRTVCHVRGGAEAPAARLRFDIGILLPFWRFDRFFDMGLLRPDFTCVALIHHCGKKRACVLSECFAFLIHICVCFELRFRLALILLGFCVSHFYFRLGCLEKGKNSIILTSSLGRMA